MKMRLYLGGLAFASLIAGCSTQTQTTPVPNPTSAATQSATSGPTQGATSAPTPSATAAPTASPDPAFIASLAARGLVDQGRALATQMIGLTVSLNHRDQPGLDALIAAQRTAGTADYNVFLTPAQFDARFGAVQSVRDHIKASFQAAGFVVLPDRFSASIIELQGPVSVAESYFSTTIDTVHDIGRNQSALTTTSPLVLPAAISADVADVSGLDTADVRGPISPLPVLGAASTVRRVNGSRAPLALRRKNGIQFLPGVKYGPDNMIQADVNFFPVAGTEGKESAWYPGYGPYTSAWDDGLPVQYGWEGSAQFPIAVVISSDFLDTDIAAFANNMDDPRIGRTLRVGQTIRVGQAAINADQAEATLAVETVTGLAPLADLYAYEINSFAATDLLTGLNSVVFDNKVAVASIGFSGCEKSSWPGMYQLATAMDLVASQAAAQGITLVTPSGNKGAHQCTSINALAASPNVVAVGGLSPDPSGSPFAHAYDPPRSGPDPQNAWSGTSGGTSTHFQTSEQLGACGQNTWRCVPDISLPADPNRGAYAVLNGKAVTLGGTEWAAGAFAAMQAEADQFQGARRGNVAGRLYRLFQTNGYNSITLPGSSPGTAWPLFHDITQGSGAAAGWDTATGLGTVDGYGLSVSE